MTQRGIIALALALVMIAVVIGGCAAGSAMSDTSTANGDLADLAGQQRDELTSYAALLRVKMRHEGKVSDFRAEVFADGDSLLSVYVRGFLGKSAFKALLRRDSLLVYFPSEHKFFSGWRYDIETGDLSNSRNIIDYLFSLLQGYIPLPDSAQWSNHIIEKKNRMQLASTDKAHRCELRVDLSIDKHKFPYQRLQALELRTVNDKLRLNVQVNSTHYNRPIPAEKYSIDLPPATIQISKDDVVELLTGVAP